MRPSADVDVDNLAGPAGSTDTVALALRARVVAAMVAVPTEMAVTTPLALSTLATAGSDDDHENEALVGRSLASNA
jgi:hypothetical protein